MAAPKYVLTLQTIPWICNPPAPDASQGGNGLTFFIPNATTTPQNQLLTLGLTVGAQIFISTSDNSATPPGQAATLARTITRTDFDASSSTNKIWFTPAPPAAWVPHAIVSVLRSVRQTAPVTDPQNYISSSQTPSADVIKANISQTFS